MHSSLGYLSFMEDITGYLGFMVTKKKLDSPNTIKYPYKWCFTKFYPHTFRTFTVFLGRFGDQKGDPLPPNVPAMGRLLF